MIENRRKFITRTAALAAGVPVLSLLLPGLSWAGDESGVVETPKISIDELMKPGPLGEMSEGSQDAQVTIVEYSSMTCEHCARFHRNVYPLVKEKYIDTGKVRLIMREFPLDRLALAATMMVRCAAKSQYFPMINVLYQQQAEWSRASDPVTALFKIAKLAGFTEERFNACLKDQDIAKGIREVMDRGRETFAVNVTPTFFINGQKLNGGLSFEDFEKLILRHLNN